MPPPLEQALRRFNALWGRAHRISLKEPNAATLATADARGRPSARTVLVKSADGHGFTFFTNLESRKAGELEANPRAALCFYWDRLMEQVIVEGKADRVTEEEADAYWATRPRKSKIAGWASHQSHELESTRHLYARVAKYAAKYAGRPIPRPPNWSGFRIKPDSIQFWKRRPFRLHERTLYQKQGSRWVKRLLYP